MDVCVLRWPWEGVTLSIEVSTISQLATLPYLRIPSHKTLTGIDQLAPHHTAGGELDVPNRLVDEDGRLAPQLEDARREVLRGGLYRVLLLEGVCG